MSIVWRMVASAKHDSVCRIIECPERQMCISGMCTYTANDLKNALDYITLKLDRTVYTSFGDTVYENRNYYRLKDYIQFLKDVLEKKDDWKLQVKDMDKATIAQRITNAIKWLEQWSKYDQHLRLVSDY